MNDGVILGRCQEVGAPGEPTMGNLISPQAGLQLQPAPWSGLCSAPGDGAAASVLFSEDIGIGPERWWVG